LFETVGAGNYQPVTAADPIAEAARRAAQAETWRAARCTRPGCPGSDILYGWEPCRCRGHATKHCITCNTWYYLPEFTETCRPPGMGTPDGKFR